MKPIFNALEYDGINSKDQDIYITGKSVYNAPERDVEFIEIAGRSGDFALDKGRWKNQEVTYTAGTFGQDQDEFASKIRQFRNLLVSRYGYHRLVDTYNPEEYRLAIFKNAIEVDAEGRKRAGEFELVFNCKPQRYLMSGESQIQVSSGDSVFNPTPFESSPLIAAEGTGSIRFGEYTIQINDVVVGAVNVSDKITAQNRDIDRTWDINESKYNAGDLVTISGLTMRQTFTITNNCIFDDTAGTDRVMGIEYYNTVDSDATLLYTKSGKTATYGITVPPITLTIGQNLSKIYRVRATVIVDNGDRWESNRVYLTYSFEYANGTLHIIADELNFNAPSGYVSIAAPRESCTITLGAIMGDSTLSTLTDTVYLDCEIGDAYIVKDGEYVSLNSSIQFGSDLPKLGAGENLITYDNTIASLKITPRWWCL